MIESITKHFFVPKNDHKNNLNILHQNVQGLRSKIELLELLLSNMAPDMKPDVLCFSETFVKSGEELNINFNNYKLAASYCRSKSRGGSCILVKKGIKFNIITTFNLSNENSIFESCAIEIVNNNIILLCIYRTPYKQNLTLFLDKLDLTLHKYIQKYPKKKLFLQVILTLIH